MTILDKIFAQKREVIANLSVASMSDAKSRAKDAPPVRGFRRTLESSIVPVSLIAEVKKASPVKGVIREDFDPVAIARAYEQAGAQCLSVLTDVIFFQGARDYLTSCRDATSLPVLRKDFTVAEHDVYEARALGADAVLLIVNGLSKSELQDFRLLAESLTMDVLVEAHTLEEAEVALETGAALVGVNNRDLTTFEVALETSCEVIPRIRDRATIVSESALRSLEEITLVQKAGARAVLIGTSFCKAPDPGAKVKEVMGW